MRIATWNLERGRTGAARAAQEQLLGRLGAEILVLTEPPASYQSRPGVVVSPPNRSGPKGSESWVAILGTSVEPVTLDIPFERMAVAARATVNGKGVVVYGAVLPWVSVRSHAPELVLAGESFFDAFDRILAEQVSDIRVLRDRYANDSFVWAGDFNHPLVGSNAGASDAARAALAHALDDLGFDAWNAEAAHAKPGRCSVDLLCGPREQQPARQGRIDPVLDGVVMSDHAGYWVEW